MELERLVLKHIVAPDSISSVLLTFSLVRRKEPELPEITNKEKRQPQQPDIFLAVLALACDVY